MTRVQFSSPSHGNRPLVSPENESLSSEERSTATDPAIDQTTAAPTRLQQQQQQQRACNEIVRPLSPRMLVRSAPRVDVKTTFSRDATAPAPLGKPDNTVALAALQRLAKSSKPAKLAIPLRNVAERALVQPHAILPVLLAPSKATETQQSSVDAPVLPWWKRILVDAEYRRRLMHLCTEGYDEELRILRDAPERLTSDTGMEVRKVWRERRFMNDNLDCGGQQQYARDKAGQGKEHGAVGGSTNLLSPSQTDQVNGTEGAEQQQKMPNPIMEEVDEVVVMAQHVCFFGHLSEIVSKFATKHPSVVIDASTLERVQRVALGAMPPIQHISERERQVQAVELHLSNLRRFSRETPYELKARFARDVLVGRVDVPMQTAITDAVMSDQEHLLDSSGGKGATRKKALQDLYSFPSPKLVQSSATTHLGHRHSGQPQEQENQRILQLPLRKLHQPPTPRWMRSQLPPGAWAEDKARKDVTLTREMLHSSLIRDPLAVEKRTAAIRSSAGAPRRQKQTLSATGMTAAAVTARAKHEHADHDDMQLRRREAAAACVNGMENLYGLQSVWRSTLPPGGFIRVSPDPRFAMWPDSDDADDDDDGGGPQDKMAKTDNTQGHPLHGGGETAGGGTNMLTHSIKGLSRINKCRAQMQRAARRVNRRTHKLRFLHSIGHPRACYADVEACETDDSSTASTTVSPSLSQQNDAELKTLMMRKLLSNIEAKERRHTLTSSAMRADKHQTTKHHLRNQEYLENLSRGARPVYNGALNINVYAEVMEPNQLDRTSPTKSRRFLGCYRQSRLLIHFKLYCRALYEEERLRCSGPGTHVMGRPWGRAPEYTPATEGALAGVPSIPHPVLKLQVHAPSLQKPYANRIPNLSTISGCRCWEGLYPDLGSDLSSPAQQAWQQLRQSILIRQAIRDIFDELPHDKEGMLDKRGFVLFVLQLLELFFPTYLPSAVHIAIAEEEWVYRGTTEHVGPQTFYEKFFLFPLIFHRNVASVSEDDVVEFWTLVRVCFHAQRKALDKAAAAAAHKSNVSPSSVWSSNINGSAPACDGIALLVPLRDFTAEQLDILLLSSPPPFDAALYDKHRLLRRAFRCEEKVRTSLRSHQYVVARSIVERKQKQQQQLVRAGDLGVDKGVEAVDTPTWVKTYRENLSVADSSRRAHVEATAEQELAARKRRLEAQEHEKLLENSEYYHARTMTLRSQTASILSSIENICSNWEIHGADLYFKQPKAKPDAPQWEVDMEEALLDYLRDAPMEVFDANVSLRGRYLLDLHFQQERRKYATSKREVARERIAAVAPSESKHSAALSSETLSGKGYMHRKGRKAESEAQRQVAMTTARLEARSLLSPRVKSTRVNTAPPPSRLYGQRGRSPPQVGNKKCMSKEKKLNLVDLRTALDGGARTARRTGPTSSSGALPWAADSIDTRISKMCAATAPCGSTGVGGILNSRKKCEKGTLAATVRWASKTIPIIRTESLQRETEVVLPPPVAHSSASIGSGTASLLPLTMSHSLDRSETLVSWASRPSTCISLRTSGDASSSPAPSISVRGVEPAATWPPLAARLDLDEKARQATPRRVHWSMGAVSEVTETNTAPPQGPKASSSKRPSLPSSSKLFVRRLRAQHLRRKQFDRQFNSTSKPAASTLTTH